MAVKPTELQEETDFQEAPYPVSPPPVQAPEPPEEIDPPEAPANGQDSGFSMDLIRRHLEQKSTVDSVTEMPVPAPESLPEPLPVEDQIVQSVESQLSGAESEPVSDEKADGKGGAFPELSEAERRLIEEHMRSRAEAERKG